MKEFKNWIKEMDREERIEAICGALAWVGLLWIGFMLSVIGG